MILHDGSHGILVAHIETVDCQGVVLGEAAQFVLAGVQQRDPVITTRQQ